MQKLAIIILNYGDQACDDTQSCLRSLNHVGYGNLNVKLFLVIYGKGVKRLANANSFSKISNLPTNTLINKDNLGFAKANNLGVQNALDWGADYLLLLNNDTIVSNNFIMPLVDYLQKNTKVAAVSPKIYFIKGKEFHKDRYKQSELGKVIWYGGGKIDWDNVYASHIGVDQVDKNQYQESKITEFTSGCAMLIKVSAWQDIGKLNEDLFLYWEDVEWCLRAREKGWQVAYCGDSYIWHNNAGSSEVGSNSQNYFLTRNRLWIGFHYARLRTKLALIRQMIMQLFNADYWTKKGIIDFIFKKMQRGSWPQ